MIKTQIASNLETAFSQSGFAQPSVAQLKTACNVSLRTLYKYFPSKELMIIAALDHRHHRYLELLSHDLPAAGIDSIMCIFERLAHWMENHANNGCMSLNALAAFPNNDEIKQAVNGHKKQLMQLLAQQSMQPNLANELFILHEGVSNSWATLGRHSFHSAEKIIKQLMDKA